MGKGARLRQERQEVKRPLSLKEMRIVEKEVMKACKEKHLWFLENEVACMLWTLHREFGWGAGRLMRFYHAYEGAWKELRDYYDMEDMDAAYLAKVELKKIGVDIEAEART